MSTTDPTMLPISKVTYQKFHETVLSLVERDLGSYVQESWTKTIYDDPNRKAYPIRTVKNELENLAREVKRAEDSHVYTGYILPGCDAVKASAGSGAANIMGWRPNMLVTSMDGAALPQPRVVNFTVFGEHIAPWHDKDLAPEKRRKMTLPLYRKCSVIAEEREYPTRGYGQRKGLTMLFFQALHESQPLPPIQLADMLKKCSNAITLDQVNESYIYQAVVLTGIKWRHARGIDEWGVSSTKFKNVPVMGSDGKPMMRQNPATGRHEAVFERIAKPEKDPIGQPFIQDLIGSEETEGEPPTTYTMKLSIGGHQDDSLRPTIEFMNYKFGKPDMWIMGFDPIMANAMTKGNFYDPDPEKNPFAQLNNAFTGSDLIAVVNFTKSSDYKPTGAPPKKYLTFIPGLVMFDNVAILPPNDIHVTPLTEEYGVVGEEATQQIASPPEPVQETVLPSIDQTPQDAISSSTLDTLDTVISKIAIQRSLPIPAIEQMIENKVEELEHLINRQAASHIIAKELGVDLSIPLAEAEKTVTAPSTSLEDQIMALDYKALQDRLKPHREAGHEVFLNKSKLELITQIMEIESGHRVLPQAAIQAQAEVAKEEVMPEKIQSVADRKAKVAQAKSKLLAQQKAEIESTVEITDESKEWEARSGEIKEILSDLIVDFPNTSFAKLWGENNDLEVFPEWVTQHHQQFIDDIIKGLVKDL